MLNVDPKAQADSSIFGAMNLGKQLNGIDDLKIISYDSYYVSIPEAQSQTAIALIFSLITTISLRKGKNRLKGRSMSQKSESLSFRQQNSPFPPKIQ
jgi:hypothetical protein